MNTIRSRQVYRGSFRVDRNFSLDDTGRVYSFGWMYSPTNKFFLELCSGSIAELRQDNDTIYYSIYSTSSKCWEDVIDMIPWMIGAREDYSDFYRLGRNDILIGEAIKLLRGYRLRISSPWQSAIIAVAQQNASFRQGWWMVYRLYLNTSRRIRLPNNNIFLETPQPSSISEEAARLSGYGYRSKTLTRVARLAEKYSSLDLVEELPRVKGIGVYSYNLVRLFSLRDYSAKPIDRWSERLVAEAYKVERKRVVEVLEEKFPGWVGLAVLFMTIAFDAEVISRALERLQKKQNRPGLVEPSPITLWKYTPPE